MCGSVAAIFLKIKFWKLGIFTNSSIFCVHDIIDLRLVRNLRTRSSLTKVKVWRCNRKDGLRKISCQILAYIKNSFYLCSKIIN